MAENKSWRGVYEEFLWTLYEDAHSIIAEVYLKGLYIYIIKEIKY